MGQNAAPRRRSPSHNARMSKPILAGAFALLLAACASTPQLTNSHQALPASGSSSLVTEAWISPDVRGEELDSVATWVTADGDTWLLATGKSTHRLSLFDGDTGEPLRTIGARGEAPG